MSLTLGVQEVNINWSKCRGRESLFERLKTAAWEFSKVSSSHNKRENITKHQFGGTMTLAVN